MKKVNIILHIFLGITLYLPIILGIIVSFLYIGREMWRVVLQLIINF